jgi:thymidylate synthase ThyX
LNHAARTNQPLEYPSGVRIACENDPEFKKRVDTVFRDVVLSGIPIAESINFVFMLENVSIELRDHIVRHRIGSKIGSHASVEEQPNLHDSSWWSQSTRCINMGRFYDRGMYREPESVETPPLDYINYKNQLARNTVYHNALRNAQNAYLELVDLGVPIEDARAVLPLAMSHRISWALNLGSIRHILGKRSCWILQIGMWEPVLKGIASELAQKVHPCLAYLFDPPCFKDGKWDGCKYLNDNKARVANTDPLHPCPLYLNHLTPPVEESGWAPTAHQAQWYKWALPKYKALWRQEVWEV